MFGCFLKVLGAFGVLYDFGCFEGFKACEMVLFCV